ncbi:MAG: hypothetical protein ACJAQT_001803 [Akkermansiaceae bacterium]|jgi:hypothetical protein
MKSLALLSLSVASLQAGTGPNLPQVVLPESFEQENPGNFLTSLFSGEQRLDLDYDLLDHDDISVSRTNLIYSQNRGNWNLEATLGLTDIRVDYTDPVGATSSSRRNEESWSGGLTLGMDFSDRLSSTFGVTAYEGFADYQSVWISEYYDQFIGIPFASIYEKASPRGLGFTTGLVWDDTYGLGRISATFGLSEDDIVPAWSPALTSGPMPTLIAEPTADSRTTYSGSLSWEKAINPSLKTQITLRYIDITARDPRIQVNNQWAWAITDDLTMRAHTGAAKEGSDFEALYGGLSLHYDLSAAWSVSLAGRVYRDTGEVVSAGFNTASPVLHSSELSASLAWSDASTTIRLGVGIYETDYDELDEDNRFFSDLYADRDFTLGRLAISRSF